MVLCTLTNLVVWFMYLASRNKKDKQTQQQQHTYHVSIYKASDYKHGQQYVDMTHWAVVNTNHELN